MVFLGSHALLLLHFQTGLFEGNFELQPGGVIFCQLREIEVDKLASADASNELIHLLIRRRVKDLARSGVEQRLPTMSRRTGRRDIKFDPPWRDELRGIFD